jgi:hypothetical protein
MGATLPYPVLPWYVIEGHVLTDSGNVRPPNTLLVQGFYPYVSTTPHMEYALTWFGLAIALLVIAYLRLVRAPRQERSAAKPAAAAPPPNAGGGFED